MKILVAPDSFKESLSAIQVANSITKGILNVLPQASITQIPISDGGEGLLDTLINGLGGNQIKIIVKDPLLRDIQAKYGVLKDGNTAVIEMATASGLELLNKNEKNPMITSSFGTGQLIANALDRGCTQFIIGIGGSATNDGGMGMIRALGGEFLNKNNDEIGMGGGALDQLHTINLTNFDKRISNCHFTVACDVTNPLTGPNGASFVYGTQKGGTPNQLKQLDKNLKNYASVIRNVYGFEVEKINGTGAAGGLGAALLAFFNANLVNGIDLVLEYFEVEKYIKHVDLIITGEGNIDAQTLQGKTISGIARLAKNNNIPVIAITGKIGKDIDQLYEIGIHSVFLIINKPMKLEMALLEASALIETCTENIIRTIRISRNIGSG